MHITSHCVYHITLWIRCNPVLPRVGLFTPDKAFDVLMKRQIARLLEPSLMCVDMVSTELGAIIQKCSEGVSRLAVRGAGFTVYISAGLIMLAC